MKRPLLSGLLTLAAAALAGCPRSTDTVDAGAPPRAEIEPGDAGPPPWPGWPLPAGQHVTAAMICQISFAQNVDFHDPCMREFDPMAAARSYMADALKTCVARLERSVLNGRAAIDPAGSERCVSEMLKIRRSGRTEVPTWEHACDAAIVGREPAGAVCREEWECAPGLACANLTRVSPGKCAPPAEGGGACARGDLHFDMRNRGCVQHLWCPADRCIPTDREGATCLPGSCDEGLFCTSGTRRCARTLGTTGAACKRTEDCDIGFYCFVSKVAPPRCEPQRAAGATCLEGHECLGDCRQNRCVALCGSR